MKRSSAVASEPKLELYAPTNVLKPVVPDIWIVDGPEITFRYAGVGMPFTTRMTVIRLTNGDLLLNSPVEYSLKLEAALKAIGPIRYLLAPNSLHYWWIPDWKEECPDAMVVAVPGVQSRAKRLVPIDVVLSDPSPWPDDIDVVMVSSDVVTEAVLFHRASRTLILTDLIENFELGRIHRRFYRWLIKLGGVADPDGKAPIDLQWTFLHNRDALSAAVQQMIDWAPDRIIIAHGRWYPSNGVAELRRAFRWVW